MFHTSVEAHRYQGPARVVCHGFGITVSEPATGRRECTIVKFLCRNGPVEQAACTENDLWRQRMNYQVKTGDTLWALARRFDTTIGELARANHIHNPNLIRAGATLRIPNEDGFGGRPRPKPAEDDAFVRGGYRPEPARVTKPSVIWKPSPNQSSRDGADIDTVVLHHTASNNTAADLATLRSRSAQVSAHYLIGRDGKIYQLVKDGMKAWHAGTSALRGDASPSVNARSIGIEITNAGDGRTPFTEKQYRALEQLVPWLMKTYKVPMQNLVGHKDVALPRGRKIDPAENFDFARIRQAVRRAT